jgi:hypothetical protein
MSAAGAWERVDIEIQDGAITTVSCLVSMTAGALRTVWLSPSRYRLPPRRSSPAQGWPSAIGHLWILSRLFFAGMTKGMPSVCF